MMTTDLASGVAVSPAIARGLQEIAEFEKDRKGYQIEGDRSGVFSLLGLRQARAGWLGLHEMAGRRRLRAQGVPLG